MLLLYPDVAASGFFIIQKIAFSDTWMIHKKGLLVKQKDDDFAKKSQNLTKNYVKQGKKQLILQKNA